MRLTTRRVAVVAVAIVAATSILVASVTAGASSGKAQAGPYVIGVSNGYYGNAARVELQAAMKAYAAKPKVKPKIEELVINNAGTSVAKQIAAGGQTTLALLRVQLEGRRPMTIREFMAGHAPRIGQRFSSP